VISKLLGVSKEVPLGSELEGSLAWGSASWGAACYLGSDVRTRRVYALGKPSSRGSDLGVW
jgi:hypothetical protein